jgi:hypothetical protein
MMNNVLLLKRPYMLNITSWSKICILQYKRNEGVQCTATFSVRDSHLDSRGGILNISILR